jgi:cytochrome d ubiquinol oxidase subunit II
MSLPALLSVLLGLSLTIYALLGGADFGAGILDLLCGEAAADRTAIATAIGPVWEANHVWLIFSITILFSAFPVAFSALGTALLAPMTVALIAIVLRGAAWGLRSGYDPQTRSYAQLSRLFGAASLVAPLALGAVAGGVAQASTSTAIVSGGRPSIPWAGTFAVTTGLLATGLCLQLATTVLTARLEAQRQVGAAERFRRRGLAAGASVLFLSIAGLVIANSSAPALAHRLTTVSLPILIAGLAAMGLSLAALARRRYLLARAGTLVSGAALIWGWFLAQSPHLIGPRLTIHAAAATHAGLVAISIAVAVVLLAVLPALYLLFWMFGRAVPEATQ